MDSATDSSLQVDGQNDYRVYNELFHKHISDAFKFSQISYSYAITMLKHLGDITNNYSRTAANDLLEDVTVRIHSYLSIVLPPPNIADNIMSLNAEDLSFDFLKQNLTGLSDFTKTLKNEFQPIDMDFVLIFYKSRFQDHDKFFVE